MQCARTARPVHLPLHQRTVSTPRLTIPVAGLGTHKMRPDDLELAVHKQFHVLDTAKAYENEHHVGAAIRHLQRPPVIITKLFNKNVVSREAMRAAVQDSTNKFGRLPDIVLLHGPYPECNMTMVLTELELMRQDHVIGDFGVSNFSVDQLDFVVNVLKLPKPALIQFECHPRYYPKQKFLFCLGHDIIPQVYRPFANGTLLNDQLLGHLAKNYGVDTADLLCTWLVEKGAAIVAKTSSQDHQDKFLNSGTFEISAVDRLLMDSMHRSNELGRTCVHKDWYQPFNDEVKKTWAKKS